MSLEELIYGTDGGSPGVVFESVETANKALRKHGVIMAQIAPDNWRQFSYQSNTTKLGEVNYIGTIDPTTTIL